jgi:UDP-N-acetylmuramoyl-tripeptide--D-alanyl-D-alanine ligase
MAVLMGDLLALWGQPLGPAPAPQTPLAAVGTDSRADLSGSLFVPLVGERFDGHRFLESALERAVAGVAQRDRLDPVAAAALAERCGRPLWLVDDTLAAYQQLGRLWRRALNAPVVAVTGSAGKTTTRELIRAALAPLGPVVASSGNENNDVGAPLTLLRADAASAALVVEMGMRGLGEIERLSCCAEPDVAVITNIGTAHIGRLGSREAIATAKCEITAALRPDGLLVIPAGDPLLETALAAVWQGRVRRVALADELPAFPPGLPAADLVATLQPDGALLLGDPAGTRIVPPLEGRHNARNLLLAVAVAQELGLAADSLARLMVDLPGGRSRRLEIGGVRVLDETYNASPEAMLAALDLLAAQPGGRRWAVLGTMLELGERSLELHAAVAERARSLGLDGLLIVDGGAEGEAMLAAADGLARLQRVASPEQALAVLAAWLQPGDAVLFKASRGVALDTILAPLSEALAG